MMGALRSMQAERMPVRGKVLSLGPDASFIFHAEHNSLFVRGCYPLLFGAIMSEPTPRLHVGRWPALALAYMGGRSIAQFRDHPRWTWTQCLSHFPVFVARLRQCPRRRPCGNTNT